MPEIEIESEKAKVAAFALAAGWDIYLKGTKDKTCICLNEMRKTSIDVIRRTGYADDSVYDSLEKSYINNFVSTEPDFEEINKTINALAAINTVESVGLLFVFLQGLHHKKHTGAWGKKEETIFPWIVNSFCFTNVKSQNVWNLLGVIFRNEKYSHHERQHAKNALIKIKTSASRPPAA